MTFTATTPQRPSGDTHASAAAWHALGTDEAICSQGTDARAGLSAAEGAARLQWFGSNTLTAREGRSWLAAFGSQFAAVLVWLLLVAAGVSAVLDEWVDAGVIAAIIVINAVIGASQEHSAERSIAALRGMTAPNARVVRGGVVTVLPVGGARVALAPHCPLGPLLAVDLPRGGMVRASWRPAGWHSVCGALPGIPGSAMGRWWVAQPRPVRVPSSLSLRGLVVWAGRGGRTLQALATRRGHTSSQCGRALTAASDTEHPGPGQRTVTSRVATRDAPTQVEGRVMAARTVRPEFGEP